MAEGLADCGNVLDVTGQAGFAQSGSIHNLGSDGAVATVLDNILLQLGHYGEDRLFVAVVGTSSLGDTVLNQ